MKVLRVSTPRIFAFSAPYRHHRGCHSASRFRRDKKHRDIGVGHRVFSLKQRFPNVRPGAVLASFGGMRDHREGACPEIQDTVGGRVFYRRARPRYREACARPDIPGRFPGGNRCRPREEGFHTGSGAFDIRAAPPGGGRISLIKWKIPDILSEAVAFIIHRKTSKSIPFLFRWCIRRTCSVT